jgi:hypothetical protein
MDQLQNNRQTPKPQHNRDSGAQTVASLLNFSNPRNIYTKIRLALGLPWASLDKIFFFLAACFQDQKFPANFFYKYEFWL